MAQNSFIKLSKACFSDDEKQALLTVLEDDGYLGMGKHVMMFEKELEAFFSDSVKVACVNTGTSALHLAVQACDIKAGDEVLIPSITYIASFQAVLATGAKPVACDIDFETGCLSVSATKSKITPNTKGIMYVHYAGGLGDRDAIFQLAREYNLRVIEDAAHSFGGYLNEARIGAQGDITCFSFDSIKNITCGEGGAIVTGDEEVLSKVQDLRLLGVEKDTKARFEGKRSWDFDVKEQGWRYHMSNLNAGLGRAQLKKIETFSKKRRELCFLYKNSLSGYPVSFLKMILEKAVPHIYPILVDESVRDDLKNYLAQNNIETGIHYKPNHLLTLFKNDECPIAESFYKSILTLPLHCNLSNEDVVKVCDTIKNFFTKITTTPPHF